MSGREFTSASSSSNIQSLFQKFLTTLKSLPTPSTSEELQSLANAYNIVGNEESIKTEKDVLKRERMIRDLDAERKKAEEESRIYSLAKEQLEQLISLKRSAESAALDAQVPSFASASTAKRHKSRHLSPGSTTESRHSPAIPAPSYASSTRSLSPLPPTGNSSSSAAGAGLARPRLKKTNTMVDAKEIWAAQLPLKPGRKVAYKHKPGARGKDEQEWILAVIVDTIKGDRIRYTVQDADTEAEKKEHVPTTIKSIVPLPDPTADPSDPSHPIHYSDLPVGTRVQAIYPETSSFYLGVVHKSAVKKGKYVVIFDEDDDIGKDVPYDMVWEAPPAS